MSSNGNLSPREMAAIQLRFPYSLTGWLDSMIRDANASQRERPSVTYRPKIYLDGNKWCALYGDNLQEGVCGFGDSPAEAMAEFDRAWRAPIKEPKP